MVVARSLYACVGSVGAVLTATAVDAPFSGVLGSIFLGTLFGNAVAAIVFRSYA